MKPIEDRQSPAVSNRRTHETPMSRECTLFPGPPMERGELIAPFRASLSGQLCRLKILSKVPTQGRREPRMDADTHGLRKDLPEFLGRNANPSGFIPDAGGNCPLARSQLFEIHVRSRASVVRFFSSVAQLVVHFPSVGTLRSCPAEFPSCHR